MTVKIFDGNNILRRKFEVLGLQTLPQLFFDACSAPYGTQIWVWDGKNGKSKRKALYPEYKGDSKPPTDEFYQTIDLLKELLTHSGVLQIEVPEYEADDIIACLCKNHDNQSIVIESNDADFLQLENDFVTLNYEHKNKQAIKALDIRLYKTLVGDPADNIKGLKGFGAKTFEQLTDAAKQYLCLGFENRLTFDDEVLLSDCGFTPKKLEDFKSHLALLKIYYQIIDFLPLEITQIQQHVTSGMKNVVKAQVLFDKYALNLGDL
jgi:5'-3' exonuclease